jgi:hypothetical protein
VAVGAAALWGALALAGDDALLAPRVSDLTASVERATLLLDQARVFQGRLAEGQSAFASEGCISGACPAERSVQLIVEAQAAGHKSRDLLQAARSEVERAERLALAPTVSPLLDEARRATLTALTARMERALRSWLVRSSWYEERMAPWAAKYRSQVAAACAATPEVAR